MHPSSLLHTVVLRHLPSNTPPPRLQSFCVALRDVRAITKMNVLVFPSGINIETASEKFVLSSFASRDRAFVNIDNIWRNCIDKQVLQPGTEVGLDGRMCVCV